MSSVAPSTSRQPAAPQSQPRQVARPGSAGRKGTSRAGLLILGLVLVAGAGLGFWIILQGVDERERYLVAARTIERWEVVVPADFTAVEANVGTASALTVPELQFVVGKWATGRIPAGTLVTEGLFDFPPLSGGHETENVLIEVSVPAGDAPFGSVDNGDKLALFGRETGMTGPGDMSLIGVLVVDNVDGGNLRYVVPPETARDIVLMLDRFESAGDRMIWKMGFDLEQSELEDLFVGQHGLSGGGPAGADEPFGVIDGGFELNPAEIVDQITCEAFGRTWRGSECT